MKKHIALTAAFGLVMLPLLSATPAYAVDNAVVVSDCSTITAIPAGSISGLFMDVTGHLCTNAAAGGGGPVTVADGADVAEGAQAATAYTGSGSTTVVGALKGIYTAATAPLAPGSAIIGKVGIDQTTPGTTNAVQAVPGTSGGLTMFTLTAANTTNATNVKNTAGMVYHIDVDTISGTPAWLLFYNNSSTPTCNASIVYEVLIPGNTSGAGRTVDIAAGLAFSSGIGICVTTGIGGTGAVAASSYTINLGYK